MKKLLPLLLVLSLAANAAWFFRKPANSSPSRFAVTSPSANKSVSVDRSRLPADLAAALASGDAAALKAAGLSDQDIRLLGIGRAFSKYSEQMRALRGITPEDQAKYWRGNGSAYNKMTTEQRAAMSKAHREYTEALRTAIGDDSELSPFGNNRFNFLSTAKRDDLRRIEQDYADMTSEVYRQQEGISLASDSAKLKLLREEKERDIMAALSPEERESYELHLSSTANAVRGRYGDAIQTEEDYRKIYALQKAFEQRFAGDNLERGRTLPARTEAQRQLNDEIRAIIGEENYAAYKRANDPDLRTLNSLQTRLNLPAGTVDQVYAMRDTYAQQSQSINANTELTNTQRREQLNALAAQAKNDIAAKLGAEGAEAFAQRTQWIQMLKNGSAFSTNSRDARGGGENSGSTVYPVRPPARPKAPTQQPQQSAVETEP